MNEQKTTVVFKDDARSELLKGINVVANAVGCTLGPRGKTVIIQQHGAAPLVTKDGVTVSKSINLKDPIQGMGGDLIKQAAERTNEVAGDGTTTATVLTHAMVVEGNRMVANGNNSQQMCRGIELMTTAVVKHLKENARVINTTEEIAQVATISANGDRYIGGLVADAMNRVGRDGIITVEDAKGTNTTLEVVEGLQLDRGYLSPYFVTNPEKMNAVYDEVCVLITDKKISDLRTLVPILEKAMQSRRPLLIIADDVDNEALAGLVLNRVKGNLPVVAIKAPAFGTYRDDILSDLCTLTGAKLASSKTGLSIEKLELGDLGVVKKLIVDAKSTTLVGDGSISDDVLQRVKELQVRLTDVTLGSDEILRLKERIAGLSSGVAVIRVGGATELEMIERKHRIEDALHATRAAAEEGIVPGGGMALLQAIKAVGDLDLPGDQKLGADIVIKACQAPLRKIVSNANGAPDVIVNEAEKVENNMGYDAVTESFKNMFEAGIVDPVKVCRTALQHASSVAMTFLMLDAVVYQESEQDERH